MGMKEQLLQVWCKTESNICWIALFNNLDSFIIHDEVQVTLPRTVPGICGSVTSDREDGGNICLFPSSGLQDLRCVYPFQINNSGMRHISCWTGLCQLWLCLPEFIAKVTDCAANRILFAINYYKWWSLGSIFTILALQYLVLNHKKQWLETDWNACWFVSSGGFKEVLGGDETV